MSDHEHIGTLIDHVTGELTTEASFRVTEHLRECEQCRQEHDRISGVWEDLGSYEVDSPDVTFPPIRGGVLSGLPDEAMESSTPLEQRKRGAGLYGRILRSASLLLLGGAIGLFGTRFLWQPPTVEPARPTPSIMVDGQPMRRFVVLLVDEPGMYDGLSPEEMGGVLQGYLDWTRDLTEEGRFIATRGLSMSNGRVVSASRDSLSTRSWGDSGDDTLISGFYEIWARDYEEALELSRACPNLAVGGQIIVSQVSIVG